MASLLISPGSMRYMEALRKDNYTNLPHIVENEAHQFEASRMELVQWLTTIGHGDKSNRFYLESLRASLLQDIYYSINQSEPRVELQESNIELGAYLKYLLLMSAGTIFALCEGYDYITSMLNLFTGIPSLIVFIIGSAFALLSIVLFYGFDLVEISKNLNVKLSKSPQLLDVFLRQIEQLKMIRRALTESCANTQDVAHWQELQLLSQMLIVRYADLDEARDIYLKALNDPYLNLMKFTTAVFAGVIFFGSGFFASQSLALSVVSLFMVTASVTSWPVVLLCSVVGLAACAVYWFVERPGLENLVGRWFGLDRDDIDILADEDVVTLQKKKFNLLEKSITRSLAMQQTIDEYGARGQANAVIDAIPITKKIQRSVSVNDMDLISVSSRCGFFSDLKQAVNTGIAPLSGNISPSSSF